MSTVTFIDPERDHRWDEFVKSHPTGLICHLSGWKQILERSFSHIKGYFPVILGPSTGDIRAGLPLYLVRSPFLGNRLVSIPFATLCGPLVSATWEMQELLSAAIHLARRLSAHRIELRALGAASVMADPRCERVSFYKHHSLSLDESPERLFKSFHRTCIRRVLRRCRENGLELYMECKREDLRDFFASYIQSRQRLGLPPQPFRLFQNLWQVFAPSGQFRLYQALYRGRTVGSLVVLEFKERASAEFITVDQEYAALHATHFLYWGAIKQACEQGFKVFDFGRTSPNNPGLMAFKQRWGTQVHELPQFWYPSIGNGRDLLANTETSVKYRLVRFLTRKSPPALLPYLGELCYRHMG